MKKTLWLTIAIAVVASTTAAGEVGVGERARLDGKLGRVEIPFVANAGLHDPAVAFSASTFEGTTFVTRRGQIVYSLSSGDKGSPGWTLTETPVHSGALAPVGEEPSETRVSHFLGDDPARWRTDVETYRSVSLGKAWPGISLLLHAYGNSIEKLFTVEPGADASRIRMRVDGAKSLRLDRDGSLLLATGLGQARFTAPIAFQEKDGVRRAVSVRYRVKGWTYGFVLGDYDPDVAVVIDPLLQATYLGGSDGDKILALAVHPTTGEVFVAGATESTNFPGTAGGAQPAIGGGIDAFVARFNAGLTVLSQASYLGGDGFFEEALALVIHPTSGEVFLAGTTESTNFPGTAGGAQPAPGGNLDAFVARLNATLTALNQATYLGGGGGDTGFALAIHPTSGEVFVSGETASFDFPGTTGGAQPANAGGGNDAFVARLNPTLTTLNQATYLGGTNGSERVAALAIHPASGEVFGAGFTSSTNFPGTTGGAQPTNAGGTDGLVVRLNATLTALNQATYLGGSSGGERVDALAIHPTLGEVFVAGVTQSANFPGTAGGAQPASAGGGDTFVARLNANLSALNQATYLGGSLSELGTSTSLAIHQASGEVFVTGETNSTNFPGTTGGAQPVNAGGIRAFVARLNATLTALNQATYLGGSGFGAGDYPHGLAIHPASGEVLVAGETTSTNFPGTAGGAQPVNAGVFDGFVARLSTDLAGGQTGFFTVTPCRVNDTRVLGEGPALTSGTERIFEIEGECGVPAGVTAVSANITITGPTEAGFLSVYPGGTPLPLVSTSNFRPGQTRANNAIIPLGVGGDIAIIYGTGGASGTVHVIIDVNGYFQ